MTDFSNHQLNTESLTKIDELIYTRLHPKLKRMIVLSNMMIIITLVIITAVVLLTNVIEDKTIRTIFYCVIGAICLITALYTLFWTQKAYDIRGYALREHDITYRSGAIFEKISTVPFSKVQQVEVNQVLMGKLCGLYELKIITGAQTQTDSQFSIEGLSKEEANTLRTWIIEKTNAHNGHEYHA